METSFANIFDFARPVQQRSSALADRIEAEKLRMLAERERSSIVMGLAGLVFLAGTNIFFENSPSLVPNVVLIFAQIVFAYFTSSRLLEKLASGDDAVEEIRLFHFNYLLAGVAWASLTWPVRYSFTNEMGSTFIFAVSLVAVGLASVVASIYKPALRRYLAGFAAAILPVILIPYDRLGYFLLFALPVLFIVLMILGKSVSNQAHAAIETRFQNENLSAELAHANDDLLQSLRDAEKISGQDSLTGLLNRRAFNDKVVQYCTNSVRDTHSHILLMDLDKFKTVNDNFGHLSGDMVLISTAELIVNKLGRTAMVGRWGGEEFIAFVPDKSREEMIALAEELRHEVSKINQQKWAVGMKISMSIGLSKFDDRGPLQEAIGDADVALYSAKDAGRNCVRVAQN